MIYDKQKWQRKRAAILRRDKYMCQESLRYGKRVPADTVHHIFPVESYPEYQWESWNLISLCKAQHNAMHVRGTHELSVKGKELMERTMRKGYPPINPVGR